MKPASAAHRAPLPSGASASPASLWPAFVMGLSVALGNGLGRFAYALLLPAMRDDLGLSYAQAGWLNTANALGYVAGAAAAVALLRRHDPRTLFVAGVALCAASLAATGLGRSLAWLSTMRVGAGIGAAWLFSCGGVLVQHLYRHAPASKGAATGLFFGGAGIGIAIAGLVVSPLLSWAGVRAWPLAWVLLGAIGVLMAAGSLAMARRVGPPASLAAAAPAGPLRLQGLWTSLITYFCIAAGYIGYVTFLFAWMRAQQHSMTVSTGVWAHLGLCVCLSPWVWRRALVGWPASRLLAWSSALALCGVLLCLADSSTWALVASATLFGVGVFIAPAAVAMLLSERLPPPAVARAMALFTTCFAVGQAIGPLIAGVLADRHGLSATLWPSAALLALSAVLPLLDQRARGRVAR